MTGTDFHDLLDRAVEPLGTMPDAVPEVLARGRRSVLRRRAGAVGAIAGATAGVVAVASAIGLAGNSLGTEAPAAGGVAPAPAASLTPSRPVASPPLTDDEKKGDGRPVSEAMRAYHRGVAPILDAALPARFGKVTADQLVHGFTVRNATRRYRITFRVDAEPGVKPPKCPAAGTKDGKGKGPVSCVARTLPNGWRAVARHVPTGTPPDDTVLPLPEVETTYQGHRVSLYMFNDERYAEQVPISDDEMLDVLADPAFAAAVVEWASHPDWTNWGGSAVATTPPPVR